MTELRFRAAFRSETGTVRLNNEDSGAADGRFLAVADGVGGRPAGEVASAISVAATEAAVTRGVGLEEAFQLAHDVVKAASLSNSLLTNMVSTLTAVAVQDGTVLLGHIGDSRAYVLRDGALETLTSDQTVGAKLIAEGKEEEAAKHRNPKALAQVLGSRQERLEVAMFKLDLEAGERLLLCTDGMSSFLSVEDLARLLGDARPPAETLDTLVEAALEAGSNDNVTAVVADVEAVEL